MRRLTALCYFLVLTQIGAFAQAREALAPGTKYDPRIPTLRSVIGHEPGERITTPEEITIYLKALAAAAPERTRLVEYARTWQNRPLHVLVIASAERIRNLDSIKKDLKRLADPRTLSAGEADQLIARLPVVTWLMHAVHGNEISSSDAALAEAYHLLAAQGDATVDLILRESIVLVDPLENPDGRARFVAQNTLGAAAIPDAEPFSAEHDEPWPGARSNHYLFDMNRDWFAQSQPETRGRTRFFLDWFPHVVVDLHEMGGNSTYYFAPPADPLNPHITKAQTAWFDVFGRANAHRFDARGFSYFIREVYDSFYPGYGESWPLFHGSIGMTYEQASARGLRFRRDDGSVLTYADGVVHHFTAAVTTAETAARHREKLLRDFLDYRRSANQEGERGPVREYLLPPGSDPARTRRLASLLVAQGFEVKRASEPFKVGERQLPAGTYIVPLAQPGSRLVRNLFEPHVPQPEAFVKEQERRRKKRLAEQIYDVTAWSLPLAFDVELVTSDRPTGVSSVPVTDADLPWMLRQPGSPSNGSASATSTSAALPTARVGYLIPWGSGAAGAVIEALQGGLKVRTADLPFKLAGRQYPAGTAFIRTADHEADLAARLSGVAARHGAEVIPIESGYVEGGISLGSGQVVALKAPRVALAWDAPASSLSAGWARFVLERRFGQPVTIVRAASLGRLDLGRYDVLVLPSGNYTDHVSADLLRRLKDWIAGGGTLVTIGEASRWATRENVALLSTTTELKGGRPDVETTEAEKRGEEKKKAEAATQPIDLEKSIEPERERPDAVPGALLRVVLDQEHWLAAGTDGEIQAMVEGSRIFSPLKLDKGRNVGVFAKPDRLVASGLVWEDLRAQLASKAFLMHQPTGRGHVIAFAEDPNFRAFMESTELLFINAVILGVAH
jgi:Zinc carboxypeptidase